MVMARVKKQNRFKSIGIAVVTLLVLGGVLFAGQKLLPRAVVAAETPTGDTKSVIVQFKSVEPVTNIAAVDRQQAEIEKVDSEIANATPYSTGYKQKERSYDNLPYAVYVVDAEGEASLRADPNVETVFDNKALTLSFAGPIPSIGGTVNGIFQDGSSTYTGDGYAVAILDTGVDKNHPALAGKVIAEACFGENHVYGNATLTSLCPGGATFSDAAGSGQDCTIDDGCDHGTKVASAAAMTAGSINIDSDGVPETIVGSASDAKIISIKIVSQVTSPSICPTAVNNICARPFASLYLAALDYVATLSSSVPIASANLSVGGSPLASTEAECATPEAAAFSAAAAALRAHNIAPVVAAGNSGDISANANKIESPACSPGAIAVAATNVAGTQIASYSNNGPLTTLLAPGGDYDGTNPGTFLWYPENGNTGVGYTQGTSFAAPIVAGAYAVLREKHPNASVDSLTALLQSSGTNITDNRSGYTVGAKKRINLATALTQSPYPTISSFTGPTGTINEGVGIALTATVANATTCSLNNGVGTVAINSGTISVTVPGATEYELLCTNAYGDSVVDTVSFTTNAAPTAPVVTDQVYDAASKSFALTWDPSTDSDGIEEYRVYLNGQQVAVLPDTTTSYTFTNLVADMAYSAEVRAVDTLGAISTAASVTFGGVVAGPGVLPGVPNTGVLSILHNATGRILLVVGLGILTTVIIATIVKRRRSRG